MLIMTRPNVTRAQVWAALRRTRDTPIHERDHAFCCGSMARVVLKLPHGGTAMRKRFAAECMR
jgi:hypothetical protein